MKIVELRFSEGLAVSLKGGVVWQCLKIVELGRFSEGLAVSEGLAIGMEREGIAFCEAAVFVRIVEFRVLRSFRLENYFLARDEGRWPNMIYSDGFILSSSGRLEVRYHSR